MALDAVDARKLGRYPFLPAARAELLAELGRTAAAAQEFAAAIAAARNPAEEAFFAGRRAQVLGYCSTQSSVLLESQENLPP